jgi:DNA-binding protein Fis
MGMLLGEATEAVEAGLIAAVLENTRGNIAQSARLLGITRVSLRRKIQSFQLTVPGRPTLS